MTVAGHRGRGRDATAMRALLAADARASTGCALTATELRFTPSEIAAARARVRARGAGGARVRGRSASAPSTTASCPRTRAGSTPRASGWACAGVRSTRSGLYVPGRHRRLSQLGADERHPGAGGRASRRVVMVVPTPDGRGQPAGAGRGRHRRRRRDLPGRRRPGGGGAGLRHGHDRPGRQDRRAGQRLCRRGQAAGVRPGRDRHDRRPVGDRRRGRGRWSIRTGSPPICCRRPSTTSARRRS